MSLKQDIDKMAEACNTCMESDPGSMNKHIDACPSCKDHNAKLEELNHMVELLQSNAQKPEEDRYGIIRERIEDFLSLDDLQRKVAIGNMLDALSELSEDDRVKIVRTRTNVIMDMSREQRNILFGTMRDIVPEWTQERADMEMRAVVAATRDMMMLKRVMVRSMFKNILAV